MALLFPLAIFAGLEMWRDVQDRRQARVLREKMEAVEQVIPTGQSCPEARLKTPSVSESSAGIGPRIPPPLGGRLTLSDIPFRIARLNT